MSGAGHMMYFQTPKSRMLLRKRDAGVAQTPFQRRQIVGTNADMMYGAFAFVARFLLVEMKAAAADAHEHITGAPEFTVVSNFATKHIAPPGDGAVDVCGKEVHVVEMFRHVENPFICNERGGPYHEVAPGEVANTQSCVAG